jgi:hypothetical protein
MAKRHRAALVAALGLWSTSTGWAQEAKPEVAQAPAAGQGQGSTQGGAYPQPSAPVYKAPAPRPVAPAPTVPLAEPAPEKPSPMAPGAARPEAAAPGAAAPEAAAPSAAAEAAAAAETFAPAEAGAVGGAGGAFAMIGDQAPMFGRPTPPPPPHPPHPPRPITGVLALKGGTTVPWIRGFKIADNQSPLPQDRVFFNFNYFNNVNYAIDRKFGAPVSGIQVYRYVGGFEKTFFNNLASIGFFDSINNLSAVSSRPGLGGTHTAMGDLNVFTKWVLYQQWDDDRPFNALGGFGFPAQVAGGRNGFLISGGMLMSFPTGPGGFAGAGFSKSIRATNLQPFLGYFYSRGNFYLHGFESINVPLDPNDVTAIFNDIGMGYYVYRNPAANSFISGVAPTFECHTNVPLNHTDWRNVNNPIATTTVVDLTTGCNFQFGQRTVLLLGCVTPVTGPRPFSIEALALLNIYFGGRGGRTTPISYPMAGQ